ncbi:hypothetical protein QWJ34_02985 [Saccharibacillus sp. CPCC 101409]|uniref:hypothetical protein n=1 Tax=Saccharibacillus sp. CPCC 101409 TaxID=3058041 RepID=UPI002670F767|nr:hypothetical protein [Saccharibacillus sp. CPCC 101409]MDO3408724.1 hypothetical protein [Saccharibacillus sp. CPCC 101409]
MEGGQPEEVIWSGQTREQWIRRRAELERWTLREKIGRAPKRTALLEGVEVDAELLDSLKLLNGAGVRTEFSCAGVSPLDEPEDHSLYAYVTLIESGPARAFVDYALRRMGRRLLVSYEPERSRYDLSSFRLGQNRSFCCLLEACAREFARGEDRAIR